MSLRARRQSESGRRRRDNHSKAASGANHHPALLGCPGAVLQPEDFAGALLVAAGALPPLPDRPAAATVGAAAPLLAGTPATPPLCPAEETAPAAAGEPSAPPLSGDWSVLDTTCPP